MAMQSTRLSWKDRANRRKQMASEVTDCASIGRVAAKYGVTMETVRAALRVFAPHKLESSVPSQAFRRTGKRSTAVS